MASKLPVLGVRIEDDLKEKLKYIADYNGRSMNKEIEQLIIRHVRQFEKDNGPIDKSSHND